MNAHSPFCAGTRCLAILPRAANGVFDAMVDRSALELSHPVLRAFAPSALKTHRGAFGRLAVICATMFANAVKIAAGSDALGSRERAARLSANRQ
jgi:hypothetical protein